MAPRGRPSLAELSDRQREVLALVAEGLTNGQIADRLGITLDGAKWHVSEIISKLGVSSREEAAVLWRRQGGLAGRMRRRALSPAAGMRIPGWAVPVAVAVGAAALVGAIALATFNTRGREPSPDFGPGLPASAEVLAVLEDGDDVPVTCSSSWDWTRPSLSEMAERFSYITARMGGTLPPQLFAWYLRDVHYQWEPRSASVNVEFWGMSGMSFPPGEGPLDRCPLAPPDPSETVTLQAIFLNGLRPLAMRSLVDDAVVQVDADPGHLHVIYFQRPRSTDPEGGAANWERLTVVDSAGRLLHEQGGHADGYEWEYSPSGSLVFASVSSGDRTTAPPLSTGAGLGTTLRVLVPGAASIPARGTIRVEDASGNAISEIQIQGPYAPWEEVGRITPSGDAAFLVFTSPAGSSASVLIIPEDTPLPPEATT